MIQQLKAIYNGTRQPFSLCAGYMVLLCRWWWDTLSGTSPEHHLPDTVMLVLLEKWCPAVVWQMDLSALLAVWSVFWLLQTRFFLAVLQSSAVFTTSPGNSRCRQRFWVDRLTVTYTGLLTLRKSDTWWMKARHMLEVGDRNWCIHSFLLLGLS